jgi:uncharacterized protein YprB with RNaseH-like and TPR domain
MDASTLRDRLRRIVTPAGSERTVVAGTPAPAWPAQPALPGAASVLRRTSLAEQLGGAWRETETGRSLVVTQRFSAHELHGRHRVDFFARDLREASSAAALVGPASAHVPFVFFDLETTGLNGGAGTHAFLVGCSWFDADDGFVVEQHLMTEYAGEHQMLRVVAAELARAGTLVTFNGKSFVAPMHETRYLFHRLESPCTPRPHVDVLHPARRFWGNASEAGCSLGVLEHQVLGVRRVKDVAGFEIPGRYFQFVRTGDARPLVAVLEHNRLDLLSLAGLTARIFHLVQAGPAAAQHPREAVALGRVYRGAGLEDRAEEAFERAVALSEPQTVRSSRNAWPPSGGSSLSLRVEALRALALGARRQKRYDVAARRWREMLDLPGCPGHIAREAIQALAIHHEHRARDLATAKRFALKELEFERQGGWGDAAGRRLARIERKIVNERRSLFPSSPLQPPSCGSLTSGRQTSS